MNQHQDHLTQWLITQGLFPDDLEHRGNNGGDTALMQATRAGERAMVRSLIASGAVLIEPATHVSRTDSMA
ncbi:MAG: hypothetical protein MUC48_14795 [Leptolyngbya sp. Prado105]|nr:hypothetical protein [Leptolyngbya sp. Prado105]